VRHSPFALALGALLLAGAPSVRAQQTFTVSTDSSAAVPADSAAKPAKDKKSKPSKGDQSKLSLDEITAANLPTAYDLVDRLRRAWLRKDLMTGGEVAIYMDNQMIGGPDKLRDIVSPDVAAMEYVPNADAVRRWGSDVKGSVIVITRRR
jgi:hypothetical protein